MERGASRDGLVVSDRLGRPGLRDVASGPVEDDKADRIRNWPVTTTRWSRSRSRSGAVAKSQRPALSRSSSSSNPSTRADGRRLWEYRVEARGPFPDLHEKHNLATSDAGHRRRAPLRLVRHRSDRRARHAWRRRLGEAPRRRVRAVRHQLGTRQLAGSLQGSADPAVRSRIGVVPARTRRADRHAALEGGSRKGARLVQHAARRARPERRRTSRELERAHRRLRSSHGRAALVRRCSEFRRRFRQRSSTTAWST